MKGGDQMAIDEALPEYLRNPAAADITYTVISVDDHLVEPPGMFEGRLAARFADRAPKVVTLHGDEAVAKKSTQIVSGATPSLAGRQAWEYEGRLYTQVGLNAVAGRTDFRAQRTEPASFNDMRPGCFDVHARVADMDLNGVWASVNFPSVITGFCGTVFSRSDDRELGHAVMQAWNDWFFEEWYGAYPERFVPMGITWLTDPELGAMEVRRNAARGFRAVTLPEMPHWLDLPAIGAGYWDPVLAACEDTGTAVCLHVGSSGLLPMPDGGRAFEKSITLFPAHSLLACVDWLWSGVACRFPGLKIVMAEGGIGWVPMLLDRLEFVADHAAQDADWEGDLPPAEVLLRNFWFCMLDDPSSLPVLGRIGAERVMIETDYPHSDSTWPTTQALLRSRLSDPGAGLTPEDIRLITHANAAAVFEHPLPSATDWRTA
jgi:predicted TIM-barrel fold metal-dependent hydrolase